MKEEKIKRGLDRPIKIPLTIDSIKMNKNITVIATAVGFDSVKLPSEAVAGQVIKVRWKKLSIFDKIKAIMRKK